MMMIRHLPAAMGMCLAVAALVGCGPSGPAVGRVQGTVTLDGVTVENAQVEFQPAQGAPSYGGTDAAGFYELAYTIRLKGALVGKHTVRITTAGEVTNAQGDTVNVPERIPPWYNRFSTLTAEVERGTNTHDFSLTTTPPDAQDVSRTQRSATQN